MFQVDARTQSSIRGVIIVIVGAGWAAYGILGGGQVFLAVMMVLSILLVGGAFALVHKRTPGEPVRR
jgi:fatty acid desaturase